jgi:hypothetical protein
VTFESGSRLERIEESSFLSSGLKSIVIPANVAFVGASAFMTDCLNSISVSIHNQYFRIRESFLEDIFGSMIYQYFGSCRSIVFSSSVVVLGKRSFSKCRSLVSVTFESGSRLERIDESAFWGSELKSIVIPSSVLVLGKKSFSDCQSLDSVAFENASRLERIDEYAFYESRLKSIVIPSSVVILGESCFLRCTSLRSVTFESGSRLNRIRECTFRESGLQSIVIPSSGVVLTEECLGCGSLE